MDKWCGIKIVLARTDDGEVYYLIDTEDFSFIPVVKHYIDLIVARAPGSISPNTTHTYCYQLRYFFAFLKQRNLDYHQVTYEDLVSFRLWLKNPYRFYGNISALPGVNDLNEKTINAIIDRVSSLYKWLKDSGQIPENPVKYRRVRISQERKKRELLAHVRRSTFVEKNILKSREPKRKSDQFLEEVVKRLNAGDNQPFFDDPSVWDALIVLRYTGRRIEDLAHLQWDCLKFDSDGDHLAKVYGAEITSVDEIIKEFARDWMQREELSEGY